MRYPNKQDQQDEDPGFSQEVQAIQKGMFDHCNRIVEWKEEEVVGGETKERERAREEMRVGIIQREKEKRVVSFE